MKYYIYQAQGSLFMTVATLFKLFNAIVWDKNAIVWENNEKGWIWPDFWPLKKQLFAIEIQPLHGSTRNITFTKQDRRNPYWWWKGHCIQNMPLNMARN